MSHIVGKDAYKSLEERLNKFPQGAPPSETLYKILSMMFTEREAELVAMLPIKSFNVKTASIIWKMSEADAEKILNNLAFLYLCNSNYIYVFSDFNKHSFDIFQILKVSKHYNNSQL